MSSMMPIDYYATINLSDDKLTASLQFIKQEANFQCNKEDLEGLLKSHSVVYGIHDHILEMVAQEPQRYFYNNVIVAVGEPAVNGEDGQIISFFELNKSGRRTPKELEDGTVDYKDVVKLSNVQKGEIIARRVLPTEGSPGRLVNGEVIPPKIGKEVQFKIGKNVVMDKEQMAIYATIDGMVVKTDREKVNVFPIYEINGDVDYSIGNIDFVGTVVIRGNVLNGFRIKASGDIRITGGVEAAEIEADGSIEISAGILGHNKGFVKAGKSVKSSFIQDANVEAKEDVIVSQSIMHSHIRAGGNVICKGVKGLIVGGLIQAGEKITVRTLGNTMSTPTAVEVGVLPELRNELTELQKQLRTIVEGNDKTDKALAILDKLAAIGQLNSEKLAMRAKLTHTKKRSIEEQTEIRDRILEIEKSLEDTDKAKVEIIGAVYCGTKIVIGRYTKFIENPISRAYFKYTDGDIVILPLV